MLIEIRELKLNLGTHVVLQDISLTLQKGQIYGLLGPNGAGKSTTISVVTGLRMPTAGSVRVLGLDPANREASCGDTVEFLSAREFALLHALLLRPGRILTRTELEERIYGWNEEVESNAVDFLIHGVRKKLGADTIKNVRGAGWMVEKSP